jgi:hypothetical protein
VIDGAIVRAPHATRPGSFARYLRSAARRGRRRTGGGLRYEAVVAILWFTPGIAIGTWNDLNTAATAGSPINWPTAGVLLLAGIAVLGLICVTIGPVTASREWRAWVLSTPLDRGILLRRRATGLLALMMVPGIVLGAVIADAAGFRHGQALAAVVLGMAAAVSAGGLAMWQQRLRPPGASRGRGSLWSAGVLAAVAVVANLQQAHPLGGNTLWAAAEVGVVVSVCLAALGLSGVGLIPLSSLAAGSGSVSSMALAVQDQSLAPLSAVLTAGPGRRRGHAPARPLSGTGRAALIAVDRRRTLRNRPVLVRWAVMGAMPYAAWTLLSGVGWGSTALVVITFVAAVAAASGLCGTARQFAGSPGLADRYGLSRAEAKSAALLLPQMATLVWGLATAPVLLLNTPPPMAVLVPLAAFGAVAFRACQAPFVPKFVVGQQYSRDLGRLFARGPLLLFGGAVLLALVAAGLKQRNL